MFRPFFPVSTLVGAASRPHTPRSPVIRRPSSILLFDEPLSNLDAKLREQMRIEIRQLQQRVGITSVYVTHDQAEAMSMSDRIVVMDHGRIMQVGSPMDVYARPRNRFVADFIGKVNFLAAQVSGPRQVRLLDQELTVADLGERPVGQEIVLTIRLERSPGPPSWAGWWNMRFR